MTDPDAEGRQRVERVAGARRARLTRVEGTIGDSDAEATLRGEESRGTAPSGERGANDRRLRDDVPPHY